MNKEEKEILKKNLLENYNLSSNINYTLENYVFPHEILLKEIKRIEFIVQKILKEKNEELYGNSFYCTHLRLYLDIINNYLEQLEIHLDVLNEVQNNNQSYKKIITKQKNIIKLNYIKLYFLKNKIEIKLKKHEKTPYKFDLYKEIFIQSEYRKMISKEAKIAFEDKKREYNAEIGLIYANYLRMDLETFFIKDNNLNDYIQRMKTEYIKIKEVTINIVNDNNHIEPLLELINNYTDKYLILMKYSNYNDILLKEEYIEILKIKYNFLKTNPNQMKYTSIQNDLYKEEAYLDLIEEDWKMTSIYFNFDFTFYKEAIAKHTEKEFVERLKREQRVESFFNIYNTNLAGNYLKNHKDEIIDNDIYFELFLTYISLNDNNYLNFLQRKVNIKDFLNEDYAYLLKESKGIELEENVTLETLIILLSSIYADINYLKAILVNLNIVYSGKYNNHTIFDGIRKLNFDESNIGEELFEYLNLFKYINISGDVELIKTKKERALNCSSIIFNEGVKSISIKYVRSKDLTNYYFPSSVEDIVLNTDNKQKTYYFTNFKQSNYRDKEKLSNFLSDLLFDNEGRIKSIEDIHTKIIFRYQDHYDIYFEFGLNHLPIGYSFIESRKVLTKEEIKNYIKNSLYLRQIIGSDNNYPKLSKNR